jgi:hypothetical protein
LRGEGEGGGDIRDFSQLRGKGEVRTERKKGIFSAIEFTTRKDLVPCQIR